MITVTGRFLLPLYKKKKKKKKRMSWPDLWGMSDRLRPAVDYPSSRKPD